MNNTFTTTQIPYTGNPYPTKKDLKDLKEWLSIHRDLYKNEYTTLYHGTSDNLNILEKGLLPTSFNRRRSYQSQSGYVYLSLTPETAKVFGDLGNQSKSKVYSVKVLIRKLCADLDQLKNKQSVTPQVIIGNSLASSILFTGCVRYKGKIEPEYIREFL